MTNLVLLTLLAVAVVLVSPNCTTKKSPFAFRELSTSAHQTRVSSTLEAVFNQRGFNYTIVEGHTCRNSSGTIYWYHVIVGDARSEVSFVEAPNGSKRARLDYLVQEEGQQHYVYRWKVALIK